MKSLDKKDSAKKDGAAKAETEQAGAGLETMAAMPCTRELCAHPGMAEVVLWSIACAGRDCQARVRVAKQGRHAGQVSQVGQISHVGQISQDR